MSSMMFVDCFRVFNLFSLFSFFAILSSNRARFKKTPKSWWKREKHKRKTPRLTHTISFPPSRLDCPIACGSCFRFFLSHVLSKNRARERTRRKHNLLVLCGLRSSIEMPSMVLVFWWLLAGQVDGIVVLFTRTFWINVFLRRTWNGHFLFWNFRSNGISKDLSWKLKK